MDSLRLDLRFALRSLLRRPGFAALAVLTLALGIGVNAVAFSAVNALLLRPFKVADADRVGWITIGGEDSVSVREYQELARATHTFSALAAEGRLPVRFQTPAGARQAWAMLVSGNYLGAVSGRVETGRLFDANDLRGSEIPVVVSHRFWTEHLGAEASLGGRTITVNGRGFSVVGVMRDDFQGPNGLFAPDMWLPLERADVLNLPTTLKNDERWLTLFGRLAEDTTPAQASAELTALARSVRPSTSLGTGPSTSPGASPGRDGVKAPEGRFFPMRDGHPDLKAIRPAGWIVMGVVGLVLLLACFNVAALLMARATERQKEIGIRAALGASRRRIMRQLVTEGMALAALSGLATLVVAGWSGSLLSTFSLPAPIPQRLHLGIDRFLVAFTAVLVLVAGVFPAILPALQATRANLLRSRRVESAVGGRPSRGRNLLVVAQVAGSTLFLAASLLFVRSFINSAAFDPGFDTKHTAVVELSPSLYGYDAPRARTLVQDMQRRFSAVNGITHVSYGDRVPYYVGYPKSWEYSLDGACQRQGSGAANECRRATVYAIGSGYFNALGVSLRAGRDFDATDSSSTDRVIIGEHLAAQLWPGEPAIGRTIRVSDDGRPAEVIGVVADIKFRSMKEAAGAFIYRPIAPAEWADSISVIVRASGEPRLLLGALQEQARAADRDMPVTISTITERMKMPLWPIRTAAGFFLICGALALALATVGLFGVLYFTVAQRTREFGIRVALGASSRRVMNVVLREGLTLAIPGVVLGSILAYVAARLLARMLFGVAPGDPLSFSATAAIEILVALAACALPAYRATRADPMTALRAE